MMLTTVIFTSVLELLGGSPESSACLYKTNRKCLQNEHFNQVSNTYSHFKCIYFTLFTIDETLCKQFTSMNIN